LTVVDIQIAFRLGFKLKDTGTGVLISP